MSNKSNSRKKQLLDNLERLEERYKSVQRGQVITTDPIDRVKLDRLSQELEQAILEIKGQLKTLEEEDFQDLFPAEHKLAILRELNFGRIVAEQDDLLESCFVPNATLREVVSERADLVLGTKGSGKSAIWVELQKNHDKYLAQDVFISPATNPTGDPEFRDVLSAIDKSEYPSEDDLRLAWRLYLLGQIWKAVKKLDINKNNNNYLRKKSKGFIPDKNEDFFRIDRNIKKYGIVYEKDSNFKSAFAFAIAKARALKSLNIKWTEGIQFEFDEKLTNSNYTHLSIPFNEILLEIDGLLIKNNKKVWIVLDRLDEIIIGDPKVENLVLKGLLLAYRDLSDLSNTKIKIFLRDDVYNRVTTLGHFPALTHIRSKATRPIDWSLEDLLHFVVRRLLQNRPIRDLIGLSSSNAQVEHRREIFYKIFPAKIDRGKAAEGFKWIVDRIKDGNEVATPRDLLSVLERARTIQLEKIERDNIVPLEKLLFDEDSVRSAVREIAKDNLETRIFAEYPDLRNNILRFKGGKADHNENTLKETLEDGYSKELIERLQAIGFIYQRERKGHRVWTIPFFYSFALDIKRGAAFDIGEDVDDEDE